ncbi:MAG: trimethylamine methyltransferase family protein [Chloroflexota bacterium]|nr:MAG: trimethylamine methyltransferase family protein [Chloroflexota bacterium]
MGKSLPVFKPLPPADVRRIDQASRQILKRIGIRIKDDAILDKLKKAGAKVDYHNQRVRFEEEWLDELLSRAPSKFTLYSRDEKHNLPLGEGEVHFANGGRVFRIINIADGDYRLTMLKDIAHTATLVDRLEHIRFYVIACQAHDVEPQYYHLNDFCNAFNNTNKHVMGGCDNVEGVRQVWKLASLIAGGEDRLRKKPFFSVITNPISPLTIGPNAAKILSFCAIHGIPVTCASAPIAGATSPVTLAGTLAQMHAEVLAGISITQIFFPGAKVLYGAVPTTMDLRNMEFSMGSSEMGMMSAAAVQLSKLYHLPIRASAGVTESKRPDIQSGVEKSFSNLMVAMAGADCVLLAAGMLDSGNSVSYEQYAIDNEIIGMVYRVLSGIRVNKETLSLDVIEQVGPGGNYIMEEHTVDCMREEFFYPGLSIRYNFDIWEERGHPDMLSRANDMVHNILTEHAEGKDGLLGTDMLREIRKTFPEIKNI